MFLLTPFNQVDYLRRQESASHLEQIEKSLQHHLKTVQERSVLPSGLTSAVILTLTYASFRHLHWINTPIFRDILIHHVSSDFRIEASTAALLTDAVLREVRSLKPLAPSHVDNSDFEFLKYLFIIAATAESERSLVSDMGLGPEIIYKMKATLKLVMTDPDDCEKNATSFLSELDAQIYEIMLEVSRDIRRYAWSIHVEKLRYMMIGVGDPVSSLISRYGARWIFDILLSIGSRSIVSSNQVAARLQKNFMGSDSQVSDKEIADIINQLHSLKLIFPVGGSRHNDGNFKWELASDAARVTADAFAVTWLNTGRKPLSGFRELNQHYQKSLLDCLKEGHTLSVKELLTTGSALAPEVTAAAFKYLGKHEEPREFAVFINEIKESPRAGLAGRAVKKALLDAGLSSDN